MQGDLTAALAAIDAAQWPDTTTKLTVMSFLFSQEEELQRLRNLYLQARSDMANGRKVHDPY